MKKKMPKIVSKIISYFKESREELKKVVWPTRQQVIEMTLAVVVLVVFIGALLGFFDYILTKGLTALLNLNK
jgi:preprotein translocase subunit SecE